MGRRKKILLLWYTIDKNFGDVLIFETVKGELERHGMQVDYTDVGGMCRDIFEQANNYDFLLFAGGGIIERNPPNVVICFKELFHMLKIPYGVIGLGIGSFDYVKYADAISFWIKNAAFFYTRDEYSAERLKKLSGIGCIEHKVDVVWANKSIATLNGGGIYKGINVRDIPYLDIWADMEWSVLKNVIHKKGYTYEISDQSNQGNLHNIYIYESCTYNNKMIINQICNCKSLIAMRYHVVLVAAANKIPVIPIVYCPKVECLAKQIGIEDFSINVSDIGILDKKIESLEKNKHDIIKSMEKAYEKMKEEANDMLDKVSDYILHLA